MQTTILFLCLFSVLHCSGSAVKAKTHVMQQGKIGQTSCSPKKIKPGIFKRILKHVESEQQNFEADDYTLPTQVQINVDFDDCFIADNRSKAQKEDGHTLNTHTLLYSNNYALQVLARIIPPPPKA